MFSRKHYLQILMVGLCLAVLAAQCRNADIPAPPTPPLPTTPDAPTLRIALLSPAEGELATFGRMARNGSMMAFDEWNRKGGVLGRHLEWDVYHTDCNFDTAREAVQQALADGHTFIIGPLCSEAAMGAATVAELEPMLMISPTATHPLVTVNGKGQTRATVFRAGYAWPWQAQAAAQFALDHLQVTQAAILTTANLDYSTTLADAFSQQFTALNGHIVYQQNIPADDDALADSLTAIAQTGAALIYLPVEANTAQQVAAQLKTLGLNDIILLGSDSWEPSDFDRTLMAGSYYPAHFALDDKNLVVTTWGEAYKTIYAIEPDTLAALSYDATTILLKAIEETNSLDPLHISNALTQTTFESITGPIYFDKQHNPKKPVPIIQIQSENTVFIRSVVP